MVRTLISAALLAATLAGAAVPVAASADDWRGRGEDRGDRGYGGYGGYDRGRHDYDHRRDGRDYRQNYVVQGYVAQGYGNNGYYDQGYGNQAYYDQSYGNQGYYDQGYYDQGYADRAYSTYYAQPSGGYYAQRGYSAPRGYYRQSYQCRGDGAIGAVIGAIAGGLIGNSVAGRYDRGAGTVIGAGGGAIAGAAIGSSGGRC